MTAPSTDANAPGASKVVPRRMEPPVGPGAEPFWEATRERRLVLPWCTGCAQPFFYPRPACPRCLSASIDWRPAAGTGTVYAFTVEHRVGWAPFAGSDPFVVGLVDLDEGIRLMTNVVGCVPDAVTIGMAVGVTWEPLSDGRHLPLFTPERKENQD